MTVTNILEHDSQRKRVCWFIFISWLTPHPERHVISECAFLSAETPNHAQGSALTNWARAALQAP